jgi:hypothetical protein
VEAKFESEVETENDLITAENAENTEEHPDARVPRRFNQIKYDLVLRWFIVRRACFV